MLRQIRSAVTLAWPARVVRECARLPLGPTIAPWTTNWSSSFRRKSLEDEAFLATIESDLEQALGDTVELEGYDVSKNEINLFMVTADPKQAFRRARTVLERLGLERGVSSAYRLVGGARFSVALAAARHAQVHAAVVRRSIGAYPKRKRPRR